MKAGTEEEQSATELIPANPRPSTYMYICATCGGTCYDATMGTKGKDVKFCTYRYCPRCGLPVKQTKWTREWRGRYPTLKRIEDEKTPEEKKGENNGN